MAAPASVQSAAPLLAEVLPAPFPPPRVPAGNPLTAAKIELGRHLFYDRRLSFNGSASCADCHRQELAFTDGLGRAIGATRQAHPRGAMSLANVAYNVSFGWDDPNLRSLEEQARVPILNQAPIELGVAGHEEEVLARLDRDPVYRRLLPRAFPRQPGPMSLDHVVHALAAFERILYSGDSPYDRLVYGGDSAALSPAARRGMDLFFSDDLKCSRCHAGFTFSGPVAFRGAPAPPPIFHNNGLYGEDRITNPGLRRTTGRPEDGGRFRAPTLRNIAVTAPYMHNGALPSLAAVVDHYARGGQGHRNQSDQVTGFELAPGQREELVAFLESLTDEAFLSNPRFADPWPRAPARKLFSPGDETFSALSTLPVGSR
ncbi:MAG: MbnH family di-heme enzyme [Acidobacteriota bacterium]